MYVTRLLKSLSLALTCASVTLLGLYGCGSGGSGSPSPNGPLPRAVADAVQKGTPVDTNLVGANNSFGFDLFQQRVQQDSGQNVFISPISLSLALEIAYNGAQGSTQQAMAQTLHLQNMDLPTLNTDNAALQASLVNPDPKVQLTIANSLWTRQAAYPISPAFIQANTTYYGSELGDLAGAPDNVNAWVNNKTNGAIPTILPPGDYSQTVAIIINAIYFKGQWTQQFDPIKTQPATFTLLDGSTKTCQMMHQSGTYSYYRGSNFQVVRLPYSQKRLSMIVVLPDKGADWNGFLSSLTSQNLNAWIGQMLGEQGDIGLPRFTSSYSAQLNSTLSALGMGVAFDPNNADFNGLKADPAEQNLYIQFVYHKTYLQVDEQGTTASGSTAVGITPTSVGPNFAMTMDHPFFCAIRDDKTGDLLFLGVIVDPTST